MFSDNPFSLKKELGHIKRKCNMVGEILKVHKSLYKDYGEDVLRNYVLYVYLKWMSLGLRTLKSYKSSQLQKRFKKEKNTNKTMQTVAVTVLRHCLVPHPAS